MNDLLLSKKLKGEYSYEKLSALSMVFVYLGVLLLLTGCLNPFGNKISLGGDLPSGFVKVETVKDNDLSVTQYMGRGNSQEITDFFVDRAQKNGWSRLSEESFRLEGYFDGIQFEKGNEVMILNVMSAAGQIIVQEIVGAKTSAQSQSASAASQEVTPTEYPPKTDVEGKDMEYLSRYPGSVRVEYEEHTGVSYVKYLVSVESSKDIYDYFLEQMELNNWENIFSQYSEDDTPFVMGDRDDKNLTLTLIIEKGQIDGVFVITLTLSEKE
jgi:hypothetical protein